MQVRVRIDPWMPLTAGFMLRLDDGSRTWIQCRYERIHKLCVQCGLIGHTRSQCSESMEEIESAHQTTPSNPTHAPNSVWIRFPGGPFSQ